METSQGGTGIFVPEALWQEALPTLRKSASRGIGKDGRPTLGAPTVDLRLASGRLVNGVVVAWSREVLFRWTGLRGPETTKDGLDFSPDDIVAFGIGTWQLLGLCERTKWIERQMPT